MTEAAIADHGLDPHEGEVRGPGHRIRCDGLPQEKGWSADQQTFVQQYGSGVLDSSLLRMSSVGSSLPTTRCRPPPWRRWTVS